MAVKKFTRIVCDITGFHSDLIEGGSQEAKAILRQRGWRFRGGIHRCPDAVAAASNEATEETDEGAGEE